MVKVLLLQVGAIAVAVGLLVGALATAAGANAASDETQAKSHLLGLSDMPNGWITDKGTGRSGSSGDFIRLGNAEQLAACIGVPTSVFSSNPPYADSPVYHNQDLSLDVQDTVAVFPLAKGAQAQIAAISSAKTPGCTTELMKSAAAKSQLEGATGKGATSVGTITVTAIDPSRYGKNATGFTINMPVNYMGISIVNQFTDVYFKNGRLGQSITFTSVAATFPTSLAKHLISVAQGRL